MSLICLICRSTDSETLEVLDEIHEKLDAYFDKPCLTTSDYDEIKPLLHKAFKILYDSKSKDIRAQAIRFRNYIRKIMAQHQIVINFT